MASREKTRKVIKSPTSVNPEISRLAGELNRALKDEEIIPSIQSRLRHNILIMPKEIREASGILIFGRRIHYTSTPTKK